MNILFGKTTKLFRVCTVLFLFAVGIGSAPVFAQCGHCICRPWSDYLPDHNGGTCSTSGCTVFCASPAASGAWNPQLTGIELSEDARPVVVAVYHNSPADQAGIRVGDAVLEINGKSLPYSCTADEDAAEEYLVRRGTLIMKVVVPRVSAAQMLVLASASRLRNAGLKDKDLERLPSLSPYISGVILERISEGFRVSYVLPGTPAEAAGLKAGARVLAILDARTNQPSDAGQGADYRAELKFVLLSESGTTTKVVRLRGLSEILSEIPARRAPRELIASRVISQ